MHIWPDIRLFRKPDIQFAISGIRSDTGYKKVRFIVYLLSSEEQFDIIVYIYICVYAMAPVVLVAK